MSFRNFPNQCSKQISDYNLLKKELRKKFSKNFNSKYLTKVKSRLYINKKTCSKRIFEDIKKIARTQESKINLNSLKIKFLSFFFILKDYFYFIVSKILSLFKNKKNSSNNYNKKMGDGINPKEIKIFFKKLKINSKLKINRFGKNGFIINKL